MRAGLLLILGACGRIGFDPFGDDSPPSDATLCAHDEDGDGKGDCDDNCPHIAGPQDDTDGDGIGDVCDPGTAQQQLTLFVPFTGTHPFEESGDWVQLPDGLSSSGGGEVFLFADLPVADVDIWIGVRIDARRLGENQLAIALGDEPTPFFYGEIYEDGATPYTGVSQFDGSNFTPLMMQPLAQFPTGDVVLRIGVRAMAQQMLTTSEPPTTSAFASIPGYTGTQRIGIWSVGLEITMRYVAIIETP